ncbi:MAG: hypothetical protein KKC55_16990 [Gammaproteobacteria bacterium]|nr:hypothetical protein [Gammaproteobacteria bacterium]
MKFHFVCGIALALTACAAMNPNPNVGLRTVNLMLQGGNCPGAMEILRRAADKGKPWAELRLGYFAYTKQCPGVSLEEGNNWLTKAACYEAKTGWEKGDGLSIGPSGFYNTREASFHAADVLQMASEVNSPDVEDMLATKWYWVSVGSSLFEEGRPEKALLTERLRAIERRISAPALKRAKALNICGPIRQQAKQ